MPFVIVSLLSLCVNVNITCEVWSAHWGLLFIWGLCCLHPQNSPRFNHFSWPAARIWRKKQTSSNKIVQYPWMQQGKKKSLFVSSQVLAQQIIHEHSPYWFSLVFLCLITHCSRKVGSVDSHKLFCKHRGKKQAVWKLSHVVKQMFSTL